MIRRFGKCGPPEFDLIPAPAGKYCVHCAELVKPWDSGYHQIDGDFTYHYECFFRTICGSVAHQAGTCSCRGYDDGDDSGLSKRDAARAAVSFYSLMHDEQGRPV